MLGSVRLNSLSRSDSGYLVPPPVWILGAGVAADLGTVPVPVGVACPGNKVVRAWLEHEVRRPVAPVIVDSGCYPSANEDVSATWPPTMCVIVFEAERWGLKFPSIGNFAAC